MSAPSTADSARPSQKKKSRGRSHSRSARPAIARATNSSVVSSDEEQVQPVDAELVVDAQLARSTSRR